MTDFPPAGPGSDAVMTANAADAIPATGRAGDPRSGDPRSGDPGSGNRTPDDHRPAESAALLGALDLGTNNCRLLIAEPSRHNTFRVVDAFSRIVRLGEGVALNGALSEPAIARTLDALAVCVQRMRRRGVTHARAVATEACRRARNGEAFLGRVEAELGLKLEIISAAEEARLAVAGCTPLLDPGRTTALVFDIGGGSTELAWIDVRGPDQAEMIDWVSLPLGVVTLAERHGGLAVTPAIYRDMVADVSGRLQDFRAAHPVPPKAAGGFQLLGTSGTVTTLAAVHLRLPRYDRSRVDGVWLERQAIGRVIAELRRLPYEARARHPCIGRDRADLVLAGCAILDAVLAAWPASRMRIADRGLREGLLVGLMDGLQ